MKLKDSIFFILFLLSFCTALLIENFALKDDFLQQDANALLLRKLNKKLVKQEQLLSDSNLIDLIDGFVKSGCIKFSQTSDRSEILIAKYRQ